MRQLLAPLALTLACAGQPAVKQTPVIDQSDDQPVLEETVQPQVDSPKPDDETPLSQSEAKILVILAQTNAAARAILKESRYQIDELGALCEMEDRGLFAGERKCTQAKLKDAHTLFCEWDKNLAASVSRLEKHQPFQSDRTRLLFKSLQMTIDEIRRMWGDFFRKYLSGSTC